MDFFRKKTKLNNMDLSSSKTLISPAAERTYEQCIKTILSLDDTNPSLCNTELVRRILRYLHINHLYSPIESASFLGAYGESMVFILTDAFGARYLLKICIADHRDSVHVMDHDGTVKEHRITDADKNIFKRRFIGGIKNQIDMEKLISNERLQSTEEFLYGVPRIQTFCQNPLFVVMEYIEGIDIFSYCETLETDIEVLKVFYPLLDFVHKLDGLGMMHRDLKPANIIVSTPRGTNKNVATPYILDWGQSKFQKMRQLTSPVCGFGTTPYTSPQCGPLGGYAKATVKDDIYSLGMLLWEMLTKKRAEANITNADYCDPHFMKQYHEARALELNKNLRLPYLVATQFDPGQRYASAADFKTLLKQRELMYGQEDAHKRIEDMKDVKLGGKSPIADCTTFIDVSLPEDEVKKSDLKVKVKNYTPRKVNRTMATMPIETISVDNKLSEAINKMASAMAKARIRSK